MVIYFLLLLLYSSAIFPICYSQPSSCKYTNSVNGITYNFNTIKNKNFEITASDGYTYSLNICGTSPTECPNDPDGVTSGMVTQTKPSPFGGACYVLGQYDDSVTTANWSPLANEAGVALTLANGSPSDCPAGTPRQVSLHFECGTTEEDTAWTVDDGGDCSYTIHYKTKYACKETCLDTIVTTTAIPITTTIITDTTTLPLIIDKNDTDYDANDNIPSETVSNAHSIIRMYSKKGHHFYLTMIFFIVVTYVL